MIIDGLTSSVVARVHRQAVVAPVTEVVGLLQDLLTRRLTAYLANVQSAKTISRWANGEVEDIRDHEVEQRLRTAYEIALLLLEHDSRQVVRAWFIGLNPQLDDVAPVDIIRDGRTRDALSAARAFVVGG